MSAECRTQNAERRRTLAVEGNLYPPFLIYVGTRDGHCKRWEAAPLNRDAIHGYGIADPNIVRVWSRRTRRQAKSWLTPLSLCDISPFRGDKKLALHKLTKISQSAAIDCRVVRW